MIEYTFFKYLLYISKYPVLTKSDLMRKFKYLTNSQAEEILNTLVKYNYLYVESNKLYFSTLKLKNFIPVVIFKFILQNSIAILAIIISIFGK